MSSHRLWFFLGGLAVFLAWEFLRPHHQPTAPKLRRWLTNFSLSTINAAASAGLCAVCLTLATLGSSTEASVLSVLDGWPIFRLAAEVLFLDCVIYWQHRLFHVVPWLWRFHEVHHTDPDLDVTTASRFHLGEILISTALKLSVVLSVGISIEGLILFETLLLAAAQFQHANISLPGWLNRVLWYSFVPPEMHRIHHCPQRRHQDSNFGTLLTLWDRVFGSLQWPAHHDPTFGVLKLVGTPGLFRLLIRPFRR